VRDVRWSSLAEGRKLKAEVNTQNVIIISIVFSWDMRSIGEIRVYSTGSQGAGWWYTN
jgi:hypothetical protein